MAALVTSALRGLWSGDEQAQSSPLQAVLLSTLQRLLRFVLKSLSFVEDLLLSWGPFQRLLLFAFRHKHGAILQQALQQPLPSCSSFDQMDYYVDPSARQLLQFAALAAVSTHLQSGEVLAPAQLLPEVSRVLLQTEEPQPKKYLEAIAAALAGQMQASLLFVDAMLLASLAGATFGAPPEAYLGAFSGARGGTGGLGRAAPKLQFAWLALREVLFAMERPAVVYIRNVEQLLAGSYDAYDAFINTFGKTGLEAALEGTASHAPLVLLGGITVNESAAALAGVRSQRQRQADGEGGGEEQGDDDDAFRSRSSGRGAGSLLGGSGSLFNSGPLGGMDDEFGLSDLSDLLFGLSKLAGETQRPNTRRLLSKIFLTRVKLQAPPVGPAAVRHGQRLQRDAADAAEEDNFRGASAVAASTGVTIPPKSSGIYLTTGGKPLAREDWERVLSWAVAMQTLRAKQDELEEEQRQEQAIEAEQLAAATAMSEAAGEEEANSAAGGDRPATPAHTGLRRRKGGSDNSRGSASEDAGEPSGRAAEVQAAAATAAATMLSVASTVLRAANPLHLAAMALQLPWQSLSVAGSMASWALYRLPLVGEHLEAWLEGTPSSEQLEAELQELEAQLAELDQTASKGGAGGTADGTLRLSELALQYGLTMLARSSGSTKAAIQPANNYERQLLDEVLSPEDCGRGFSEVGALTEAKSTLREAVQLPLKHPELFSGGALARPSKGVLLFGPPGTGKTLVARAAAAECGAAFLAINPSALASKWFGDTVKYTRAAFSLAAKLAPCVLFIDEVDSLLGQRNSSKEHEAMREMRNEFMLQWDGIRPGRERVMVLGATNRPFDLDEAVLRRFTHRIFIGLPDRAARQSILEVVLQGESLAPDLDLSRLAELTEGYSGSDLKQLSVQAAMRPVRAFLEQASATVATEVATAAAQEEVATGAPEPAGAEEIQAEGSQGEGQAADKLPAVPGAQASGAPAPAAAVGLPLVPRLNSLLRQAERIASRPANPRTDLRPISMQDFEEAIKEVGPSVDPDSSTIQELKEWAKQFGTTGSKQGLQSRRLSYFT